MAKLMSARRADLHGFRSDLDLLEAEMNMLLAANPEDGSASLGQTVDDETLGALNAGAMGQKTQALFDCLSDVGGVKNRMMDTGQMCAASAYAHGHHLAHLHLEVRHVAWLHLEGPHLEPVAPTDWTARRSWTHSNFWVRWA